MMDIREFREKIKEELPGHMPEELVESITLESVEISKMNDQKLYGITVKEKGSNMAPTLYVNEFYERYQDGEDLEQLITEFAERTEGSVHVQGPPETDLTWDSVKDSLSVRLLEKSRNKEFLSNMPYADVGNGLALTADINLPGDSKGEWKAAVTHSLLESLGVDKETLFASAMESAVVYDPPVLMDMSTAVFGIGEGNMLDMTEPIAPEDIGRMYVLTTKGGRIGACALFYPEVKEKMAELFGSGYYILPSSTHEVIIVPDDPSIVPKDLTAMVKHANEFIVEPQDVLSDNVLHYDRDARKLSKADPERNRADMVAESR